MTDETGPRPDEVERDEVEREVVQEDQEEIKVYIQDRLGLEARLEQEEDAWRRGDEVELAEKSWRKRADESIDQIRRQVDAMERPGEPEDEMDDWLRADSAFDEPDEPEAPFPDDHTMVEAPEERELPDDVLPLTDEEYAAIAEHVPGGMVKATPIYRGAKGQVVEVIYREDGEMERTLLTVLGQDVRDIDSVGEAVDRLSTRSQVVHPDAFEDEVDEDAFHLVEEDDAEEDAQGFLSRLRRDPRSDEEETGEEPPEPEELTEGEEDEEDGGGLLSRFRRSRKDEEETREGPEAEEADDEGTADDPSDEQGEEEDEGDGGGFLSRFRRRGD